ncbi:hypothetical protein [Nocardia cerradoensis]|uniref:hypothetical protein n=1 Tax=Nocardia cerradoensis TaxID=85688 RepID=UPI00118019F9|nr:hypothetical protein [Nocardia cerradoensis]
MSVPVCPLGITPVIRSRPKPSAAAAFSRARTSGRHRQVISGIRFPAALSARSAGVSDAVRVHSRAGRSTVTRSEAGPVHATVIVANPVWAQAGP